MGQITKQFEEDRLTRAAARGVFDARLSQVKRDLAARGIGGRIADKLTEDAVDMLDEAVEVADENRGIIAGTIALLVLWLFRNPIICWVERLIGAIDDD